MELRYPLLWFTYHSLIHIAKTNELVNTNSGPIRGKIIETPTGNRVTEFTGIPYAEPPLDKLRFRPPQKVKPWSKPLDATNKSKACIQFVAPNNTIATVYSPWYFEPPDESYEDCLYLNIWVPNPQPKNTTVLIWIHGGSYYHGFSSLERYNGQILASEENVIVASMNYRLGVLGFLYFGVSDVPGNVGLMDQTLAIKWVYDNIEFFGGDPRKITVFGESAGASSTGYQLSNLSRQGLVKRAILLSGTSFQRWAKITKEKALESASNLAKESKCDSIDIDRIIKCLRNLPIQDLTEASFKVVAFRDFVFPPVIDDKIVSATPEFQNANSVLFGEILNDGGPFMGKYQINLTNHKFTENEFLDAIKNLIFDKDEYIAKVVQLFYTNRTDYPGNLKEQRSSLVRLITDTFMTCGINEFGSLLNKEGVKSYRYIFDHLPSGSDWRHWPYWLGPVHGDEVEFLFGGVLNPERGYTEKEKTLSRRVMKLFSNFAKTGNPNEVSETDPEWPMYSDYRQYLRLGLTESVGNNYRAKECSFWKDVIEVLQSREENCSKSP